MTAAAELLREGVAPSIPAAAERALVSVPTAYRYFPTADGLWFEAAEATMRFARLMAAADEMMAAAGPDPAARIEALVRVINVAMIKDQTVSRRIVAGAMEAWFAQRGASDADRVPVRQARRTVSIATVLEPLRDRLDDAHLDRIANALCTVVGTEAAMAIVDGAGLEGDDATAAMVDAARWLLIGALADLGVPAGEADPGG